MTREEAKKKAEQLVEKMTVYEMISQLLYVSDEIERLNVHEYNWWNEALHGVARAGVATVFPQAIGMAAAFNPPLVKKVAEAISLEGRAKYNKSVELGDYGQYRGLTYWSPNINIYRDPRWGRGQETYGEDPFLTAENGCAFVEGLQGDGEFLRSAACAKHFAVHSGPEADRHFFNAEVNDKDLFETYLPAFEMLVKRSKVESVMGAYNRVNGYPCCAHPFLIKEVLRNRWKFEGHVVSDCGALADFVNGHKVAADMNEAAAMALKGGCDLNCGGVYNNLTEAYEKDMVDENDIKTAAVRLFTTRFLLGEFEEERPYSSVPYSVVNCKKHKDLNYKIACESIVLLKNDGTLPLDKNKVKKIAVIGPNGDSKLALLGNYHGWPNEYSTVADGVRKKFNKSGIFVDKGAPLNNEWLDEGSPKSQINNALVFAKAADITLLCVGFDETTESEEGGGNGDRVSAYLPESQRMLMEQIAGVSEKTVIITFAGGRVDFPEAVEEKANAIIHAWYPGARGGEAIASVLCGEVSPSGRLPVTFYKGDEELPSIKDYSMHGRTYRYFCGKPLYPFGYGLSYSKFDYRDFSVKKSSGGYIAKVTVKNVGNYNAEEVVQLYAKYTKEGVETPNFQLVGVKRVYLKAGEEKRLTIKADAYWVKAVKAEGERIEPDAVKFFAGGHLPDERSKELGLQDCLCYTIK